MRNLEVCEKCKYFEIRDDCLKDFYATIFRDFRYRCKIDDLGYHPAWRFEEKEIPEDCFFRLEQLMSTQDVKF